MKFKIGTALAVAALAAFSAAGVARAQATSLPSSTTVYVQCVGGDVWVVDPALIDGASFGQAMCPYGYTILSSANNVRSTQASDPGDSTGAGSDTGGIDVGLGADPMMQPDPSLYSTEVQCPDGSIWAIAQGDQFVCPAA